MEAFGELVAACHVARAEGDDLAIVSTLFPLLNAAARVKASRALTWSPDGRKHTAETLWS